MAIFDCKNFLPFDLASDYEALCLNYSILKRPEDLAQCGYAVVPASWGIQQNKHHTVFSITAVKNSPITLVKLKEIATTQDLYAFKKEMLSFFIDWQKIFLANCYEHLSQRKANDVNLLHMTHLQQHIARIISNVEFSMSLLTGFNEIAGRSCFFGRQHY